MQAVAHELPGAHKHDHAPTQPIIVQPDMALPRPPQRAPPQTQTFTYTAIPSIELQGDRIVIGDSSTSSQRSWTQLKIVGDGSFGTVALCDWHSPLSPNTPLSPMRVRSEWAGRRLVALKRMKRQWEGGWDECKTLKEIESLRVIPSHPNIIPLYDSFILPSSRELYLVFEAMEGNLYQLIKTRKGKKALAGGLVTSIFFQVASALDHVHDHGYFHRDMKPENLLVTTTGLANYVSTSPNAGPNAPREEDVFVIIKLADFGLARETASRPPYTEYVSTRWYRAPEVLLRSRDYSAPVDMWAFGTIMAELLNLRPLFPGSNELDQLRLINDTLGDPSDAYGFDENGRRRGGGPWRRGHDLGRPLGYQFPRNYPTPLVNYFSDNVPRSLIECIEDLLRYEPADRLTAKQCLQHRFLAETAPGQPKPPSTQPRQRIQRLASPRDDDRVHTGIPAVSPRAIPPNHAMSPPDRRPPFPNSTQSFLNQFPAPPSQFPNQPNQFPNPPSQFPNQYNQYANSMPPPRQPVFRQRSHSTSGESYDPSMELVEHREGSLPNVPGSLEAYSGEDVEWHKGSYTLEQQANRSPYAMDMETPAGPSAQPDYAMDVSMSSVNVSKPSGKRSLFGLKKLGSAMFGHSEKLPPVAEANPGPSGSQTSLKRTQSNSTTDGKSIKDVAMAPAPPPIDPKRQRKLELMEKRKMDKERLRAQAKSVVAKREMMYNHEVTGAIVDHESGRSSIAPQAVYGRQDKGKNKVVSGGMPLSQPHLLQHTQLLSPPSIDPAWRDPQQWRDSTDDDRSVASSDRRRMSMATVNTVDSDPGPVRTGRQRGSSIGINRATSVSSLRAAASGGGFPRSARSSASLASFEQFTQEFHLRANVADDPNRMGSLSPGPGGHNHSHWPVPPDLPQLVLNGQNRRIPGMSSFTSAMSPESSLRGSLSPASPYDAGPYNQLPSLFQEPPRGHQTLPPFSELVAPLEHA